jgi:hypothetical protein
MGSSSESLSPAGHEDVIKLTGKLGASGEFDASHEALMSCGEVLMANGMTEGKEQRVEFQEKSIVVV